MLREFQPADYQVLFDLYRLPETSRFESWQPHESVQESRELLEYWIERQSDDPRTDFTFAIELSGNFIGLCGIELGIGIESDDPRTGFVGYRIHPSHWGHGYATEALSGLLAFGFDKLELHRIHSGCVVSNIASLKVLEKGGLEREGTTRESFPIESDWFDYALFGILESEWRHITKS